MALNSHSILCSSIFFTIFYWISQRGGNDGALNGSPWQVPEISLYPPRALILQSLISAPLSQILILPRLHNARINPLTPRGEVRFLVLTCPTEEPYGYFSGRHVAREVERVGW